MAGVEIDKDQLQVFSLGKQIGSERFVLAKSDGGYRLTIHGAFDRTFILHDMRVRDDWSVIEVRYELREGSQFMCAGRLASNGLGVFEWTLERHGKSRVVDREPIEIVYQLGMRPAATQFAICAVGKPDAEVTIRNMPGYRVDIAPREQIKLGDGRTVDKLRVDKLIDVYCDGRRLAWVHYSKHGLLAVRPAYMTTARQIAASDPTDKPWTAAFKCPEI